MTENFIFRWFKCGLSVKKTCEICDVSQKTVSNWDKGKPIPEHHKRLMLIYSGQKLDHQHESWKGWTVRGKWIITPFGDRVTTDQILWMTLNHDDPADRKRKGLEKGRWTRRQQPKS